VRRKFVSLSAFSIKNDIPTANLVSRLLQWLLPLVEDNPGRSWSRDLLKSIRFLINWIPLKSNQIKLAKQNASYKLKDKYEMFINIIGSQQVGNLSEHARRKSIWRHILGVFRGFIWF
jgi:hypothetical protein